MEPLPKITNFTVRNLIGEGGMANIYSAYNKVSKERVAIKVIHETLSTKNPKIIELFVKEAKFVFGLSHPNLIEAFELKKMDNGLPFMTMELIKGLTLKEILNNKKAILPKDALYIISKVASALAYLHGLGIYHRDIKPSNIMVERGTKRVLLTDFGIAKESIDTLDHRSGNKVSGTALYMSPEQVMDDHVTGKTDIYSLGVCFYVLLMGYPPFVAKDKLKIRKMHVHTPFPHLPKEFAYLDEFLQTMCHKRPDKRYSAITLLEKLHQIKKATEEITHLKKRAQQQKKMKSVKKKNIFSTFTSLIKRK